MQPKLGRMATRLPRKAIETIMKYIQRRILSISRKGDLKWLRRTKGKNVSEIVIEKDRKSCRYSLRITVDSPSTRKGPCSCRTCSACRYLLWVGIEDQKSGRARIRTWACRLQVDPLFFYTTTHVTWGWSILPWQKKLL